VTSRAVIVAEFAAIIAAMVLVDLVARRTRGGPAPLATALTGAMRTMPGRLLVLGVWLWLGWHFLAR
jgi:hypothetical protein